jgi:hypothetical protein
MKTINWDNFSANLRRFRQLQKPYKIAALKNSDFQSGIRKGFQNFSILRALLILMELRRKLA